MAKTVIVILCVLYVNVWHEYHHKHFFAYLNYSLLCVLCKAACQVWRVFCQVWDDLAFTCSLKLILPHKTINFYLFTQTTSILHKRHIFELIALRKLIRRKKQGHSVFIKQNIPVYGSFIEYYFSSSFCMQICHPHNSMLQYYHWFFVLFFECVL